jgi:hypothetical protein
LSIDSNARRNRKRRESGGIMGIVCTVIGTIFLLSSVAFYV